MCFFKRFCFQGGSERTNRVQRRSALRKPQYRRRKGSRRRDEASPATTGRGNRRSYRALNHKLSLQLARAHTHEKTDDLLVERRRIKDPNVDIVGIEEDLHVVRIQTNLLFLLLVLILNFHFHTHMIMSAILPCLPSCPYRLSSCPCQSQQASPAP